MLPDETQDKFKHMKNHNTEMKFYEKLELVE